MYKCRLVYDEWKSMIKKSRTGMYENSADFCGYVGLLTIDEVSEPQIWKHGDLRFTVLDSGYKWLSIMPEKDYYCITVMMDSEFNIIVSYIDMIDEQGIDNEGVPYFYDCYLDLIVYSDGSVNEDDRDELDAAHKNGDITEEQYNRTIHTADTLKRGLLSDYEGYLSFVHGRLDLLMKQVIRSNGIPFPISADTPNKVTLQAIKEAEKGEMASFSSIDELMEDLKD